jgi:hypothetical protein
MSKENYHRYPSDEKLKGIDYKFYNQLMAGKYDREINRGLGVNVKGAEVYAGQLIKA